MKPDSSTAPTNTSGHYLIEAINKSTATTNEYMECVKSLDNSLTMVRFIKKYFALLSVRACCCVELIWNWFNEHISTFLQSELLKESKAKIQATEYELASSIEKFALLQLQVTKLLQKETDFKSTLNSKDAEIKKLVDVNRKLKVEIDVLKRKIESSFMPVNDRTSSSVGVVGGQHVLAQHQQQNKRMKELEHELVFEKQKVIKTK